MDRMFHRSTRHEGGFVSILVVIFAAILLTIISVSYISMMIREESRSADTEQSQGAYDSAIAGVEDAKRVISACKNDGSLSACNAIAAQACDTVQASGVAGSAANSKEVQLQSTTSQGQSLNQAYTCVKVAMDTPNYQTVQLNSLSSTLVPLRATAEVHSVKIQWQRSSDDNITGLLSPSLIRPSCVASLSQTKLCSLASWSNSTYPAILRVQAITPGSTTATSFNLSDLDKSSGGSAVFLYPNIASSDPLLSGRSRYAYDSSGTGTGNGLDLADCRGTNIDVVGYACTATITLPFDVSAGSPNAALMITPIYKKATALVTLYDKNGNPVKFSGVQPMVDSTGRANDLYRRVSARLSLTSAVLYPNAALSVAGDICKDFAVTSTSVSRVDSLACTP